MNCAFPKAAPLDLRNGKYSTIRIEYPWVPQNYSHYKIFGHSRLKFHVVKEMDTHDSERIICPDHNDIGPATGYVDAAGSSPVSGSVSVVADIGDLFTNLVKAGKVKVTDIPIRLTGNTFECLSICDDADTLEVVVERGPSRYESPTRPVVSGTPLAGVVSPLSGVGSLDSSKPGLPNLAYFSDTSPNCETFKHIKRIDELDYLSFPLSKKKLKKHKKQKHVAKSANASSVVVTNSPYIMEFD